MQRASDAGSKRIYQEWNRDRRFIEKHTVKDREAEKRGDCAKGLEGQV